MTRRLIEDRLPGCAGTVLEVLPVGKEWSGLDLPDAAQGPGADFNAFEKLRRLALAEKVAEPEQSKIWHEEATNV
jgi:hypothetical protein